MFCKCFNSARFCMITDNPEVTVYCTNISEEGSTANLTCVADSNPASQFTWRKGTTTVATSDGAVGSNRFTHLIPSVDRTHVGIYTCVASNGIPGDDEGDCSLAVRCKLTA